MDKQFYVYILTNKTKSVVYTGVTSDLIGRIYTHRNDLVAGFTVATTYTRSSGTNTKALPKAPSPARSRSRTGTVLGRKNLSRQ